MIENADAEANPRPASIKQAAEFGTARGHRDAYLREFLDEFYCETERGRRASMLEDEPPSTGSKKADAYYARRG